MSRRSLINELVANGYEPGVLDGLNTSELCILVQEEVTGNVWSPEARARAIDARHARQGLRDKGKRLSVARHLKLQRKASRAAGLEERGTRDFGYALKQSKAYARSLP